MWFLLFVIVASVLGTVVVLLRHRRPTSMEASISEFGRSLDALAPERGVHEQVAEPGEPDSARSEGESGVGSAG